MNRIIFVSINGAKNAPARQGDMGLHEWFGYLMLGWYSAFSTNTNETVLVMIHFLDDASRTVSHMSTAQHRPWELDN